MEYNRFLQEIVKEIRKKVEGDVDFDVSCFMDFERVKSRIVYRLINYRMNRRLLEKVPHQKYLDLVVVFCCLVYDEGEQGQASILIHNDHLKYWGVDRDEVANLAYANTPSLLKPDFVSIGQILSGLCGEEYTKQIFPVSTGTMPKMTILTNRSKLNGAACMLYPDILAEFAEVMDSNFVILPSSIHEVILVPVKEDKVPEKESFCRMICEVNKTQVADTEVLSDHPYFYSRMTARIVAA